MNRRHSTASTVSTGDHLGSSIDAGYSVIQRQGEDDLLHHGHRHRHHQRQGLPHQLHHQGGHTQERQGK